MAALDALTSVGARVLALVVPSNRTGSDVEEARVAAGRSRVPVLVQPARPAVERLVRELRALAPDVIAVWSYSMILPPSLVAVPRRACVNVHGGLLPGYRGPHVMQWAIINGETETGVTLHHIDEGVDTGPVIGEARVPIGPHDDAVAVRGKLKEAGVRLLTRWWPAIVAGTAPRVPQDEARARYYPLRGPEDGRVDWSAPAETIRNLVRALVAPWPGAFTTLDGARLVLRRAAVASNARSVPPGVVAGIDPTGVRVGTGAGDLLILDAEVDGLHAEPGDLAQLGLAPGIRLGG